MMRARTQLLISVCLVAAATRDLTPPAWAEPYNPIPLPESVFLYDAARFTVLTDGLIRLEWSPDSPPRFHDAGTFFAVHRRFPTAPAVDVSQDGPAFVLRTPLLRLEYTGGEFSPDSLSIALLQSGVVWHHGDAPSGSLHGTIRTLDRVGATVGLHCTQPAHVNDSHCEEGVVSRDGWAIVDDSAGPRWDTHDYAEAAARGEWPWVTGPAESPASGSAAAPPPADACTATGFDRFECVWGNTVDEGACRAKGCCFDANAARAADGQPPAFHFTPWCFWPQRARRYVDLYFFGRGADYRGALSDFTALGGRVPLLPRWALGPHFSRWFAFSDAEERGVLTTHGRLGIPLDTLIIDTDWHHGWRYERGSWPAHPPRFPNGPPPRAQPISWTGYDVNEDLLPAQARLHAFLHARGVATALNLHLPPYVRQSGGVQYIDSAYRPLALALGLDADEGETILGDYSNRTWATAFFALVVQPLLVDLGVDFAWPDWQQGEWTPMLGLPPTPWLSYLFASSPHLARPPLVRPPVRRSGVTVLAAASHAARSLVLNRWGGLGAHRYPVGFSGDAETTWEVLKLQVYITATAANVAFQWSHDIGGFAGAPNAELMTRWTQMGVFSPVLRPHCAGRGGNQRDIWRFEYAGGFEIMRDYFRLRARLVPYLATAQRHAYESGVVPVHPLYYDYPDAPLAYEDTHLHQHAFGDDIWVAPITSPAPDASGLAHALLWFPPGRTWIEWFSWQAHTAPDSGGAVYERRFALDEVPVFSPAGSIIPLRTLPASGRRTGDGDVVGTAVDVPDALTLWVFPPAPGSLRAAMGSKTFTTRVYDDDGVSMAYVSGAFRWTNVSCVWSRATAVSFDAAHAAGAVDSVTCTIGPGGGSSFPELPLSRRWTLRFISTWPPVDVIIGDAVAVASPDATPDAWGDHGAWPDTEAPAWTYAGGQATTWVHTGAASPVDALLSVRLTFPTGAPADDPLLTSALARKITRAQAAKRQLNLMGDASPADLPSLLRAAGTGAVVEAAVAEAGAEQHDFFPAVRSLYEQLGETLGAAASEAAQLRLRGTRGPALDSIDALLRNALE